MSIRGLVLAGGKSSRFGEDKALAIYDGLSFLERAVSLLERLGLKPIVVTRRGANYPLTGHTVIYDKLPEKGPIGGLYTAMTVFKKNSFLVLPCDMPVLTLEVLSGLLAVHEPRFGATVYSSGQEGIQPFPGIYEPSVLKAIRDKLKGDDLSMAGFFKQVASKKTVDWEGDPNVFCNINTAAELKACAKNYRNFSNEFGDFRVSG